MTSEPFVPLISQQKALPGAGTASLVDNTTSLQSNQSRPCSHVMFSALSGSLRLLEDPRPVEQVDGLRESPSAMQSRREHSRAHPC